MPTLWNNNRRNMVLAHPRKDQRMRKLSVICQYTQVEELRLMGRIHLSGIIKEKQISVIDESIPTADNGSLKERKKMFKIQISGRGK